ncbi:GNAT family N-acetyltransferase [Arthrobacter sp. GMC3]|uniref:GNAT family N-acetyltransferase n=1 Tax=Arthrobacter sp. GMC3 TaxID=2058894 RepID=UPI0015E2AF24|nr:GNAT family N-acetyltransferase [Arthrobacter sp. GMC3]
MSDSEFEEFEDVFPLRDDSRFREWKSQLETLPPSSVVSIREAVADGPDGRRMRDVQLVTERLPILEVKDNVPKIGERVVLLAEIDGVYVGFCISSPGPQDSAPLFIQEVGVVPNARGRGIGMALLCAAAEREPWRNIAFATEDNNDGAHALNKKFAKSIGASIGKVPLDTYRDSDFNIQRGRGYRAWVINRPPSER